METILKTYSINQSDIVIRCDIFDNIDDNKDMQSFATSDLLELNKSITANVYPYHLTSTEVNDRFADSDEDDVACALKYAVDFLITEKNVKCIGFKACASYNSVKNKFGDLADVTPSESMKNDEFAIYINRLIERESNIAKAAGFVDVNDRIGEYEHATAFALIVD